MIQSGKNPLCGDFRRRAHFRDTLRSFIRIAVALTVFFALAQWIFGTVCPLMFTAGLPCPGCGLTRAGVLALTGRFRESLHMHPLLFPAAAFISAAAYIKLIHPDKIRKLNAPGAVLLLALLGLYVFRMVRYFPHTLPMVPNEDALLRPLINYIWRN